MSPRDVVEAPLNPDNIHPGFSRFEDENLICLITDTCKRSIELLGSTKIHLTLKSLIPNIKIRHLDAVAIFNWSLLGER